ncbi:YciI family protein [Sandaracinus amylolyticus]|uniref:PhnB protein n=1 Tax=Sandaracinus amylolyticus TaxID=927083 RepID=A0A0F6W9I7_9BACT|nr:YciI family protein [Sandaracinus amylolyticus]AKF10842.1 PhnB protein [Sandaracinus amylolyticus]
MRVLVIIKANKASETGQMPSEKLITEMGKFNEDLLKAGVLLGGEGLHPSSKGKRVVCSPSGKKTVVDGPFAETKELIAGFWIWKVASMQEAVDWVRRVPMPEGETEESTIEIRPIFEAEDFGAEFTAEERAREDRMRAELEARAAKK